MGFRGERGRLKVAPAGRAPTPSRAILLGWLEGLDEVEQGAQGDAGGALG